MMGRPEEAEVRGWLRDWKRNPAYVTDAAVQRLMESWLAQGRVIEAQREALVWLQEFGVKMIDAHPGFVHVERRARAACPADPKEQISSNEKAGDTDGKI